MKKPSKTAAELEASIKVEMEDICDWPTDMMISVQPDGDSWKVAVVQEGSVDDADRREMVEQIAARLKGEYDLKGWPRRAPLMSPTPVSSVTPLDLLQPMSRCYKNVASPVNSIASGWGPDFVDHCGRPILYGWAEGIEKMVIETVLFIAFAVIVGAAIVKAYEWHQDVLYGPYKKRIDWNRGRDDSH
jgi:hypothetical protein